MSRGDSQAWRTFQVRPHFPEISGGYNRVDKRIANILKIMLNKLGLSSAKLSRTKFG